MSQIRSDILFTRKIQNARECEREMQRLHIATPICDDENKEHEHELNEDIIQVSDDEDDEEEEDGEDIDDNREELIIESETQKWSQLIDEWIEFGNQENRFGDENDESFLSSEWNSDFNFAGRSVHPADDEIAKWSLTTLFESSLESPLFLDSDKIFTNAH